MGLTDIVVPRGIQFLLWALLVVSLLLIGRQVLQWREDATNNAAKVDQRDQVADATIGTAQDLATLEDQGRVTETRITIDTAQFQRDLERLSHERPTVDAWGSEPVPSELRELARARRCARNGPGNPAPGCPAADPGASAPARR